MDGQIFKSRRRRRAAAWDHGGDLALAPGGLGTSWPCPGHGGGQPAVGEAARRAGLQEAACRLWGGKKGQAAPDAGSGRGDWASGTAGLARSRECRLVPWCVVGWWLGLGRGYELGCLGLKTSS